MELALSKLALAEKDDMVNSNLIGTNMGLRIIKIYSNYLRVGSHVDKDENIFCWIHKKNKSHGSFPILLSTSEHNIILLKCIYVGI